MTAPQKTWKPLSPLAKAGLAVVKWFPAFTTKQAAVKIAAELVTRAHAVEADSPTLSGAEKKADVLGGLQPGPLRELASGLVDDYVTVQNAIAQSVAAARAVKLAVAVVRARVDQIAVVIKAAKA